MSRLPGFSRLCVLLLLLSTSVDSSLEPGRKTFTFTGRTNVGIFLKSLYKDAIISISGRCSHKSINEPVLRITGTVKYGRCAEKINDLENVQSDSLEDTVNSLNPDFQLTFGPEQVNCTTHIKFKDETPQHQTTLIPPTIAAAIKDEGQENEEEGEDAGDEGKEEPDTKDRNAEEKDKKEQQTKDKDAAEDKDKEEQETKEGDTAEDKDKEEQEAKEGDTAEDKDTNQESKQPSAAKVPEEKDTINQESEQSPTGKAPQKKDQVPTTTSKMRTTTSAKATAAVTTTSTASATATQVPASAKDPVIELEDDTNSRKRRSSPKKHPKNKKTSKQMKGKAEMEFGSENKPKADSKAKPTGKAKKETTKKKPEAKAKVSTNDVLHIEKDGVYILMIKVVVDQNGKKNPDEDPDFSLTLDVSMKNKVGYLSAADWPLLPFYGAMSLLYLTYGIVWLVISACYWRDILRIQFWIGGVIALGMLEKAIFYSEYSKLNHEGYKTGSSLLIFAEVVSCFKRTLARILILIVSMGFGIVRPRLGSTLHKVLGVGFIYFLLATIEGCYRTVTPTTSASKEELIARIPLAVLDSAICWWIFMSLVQTTRTLRIRRNTIKLSLYRHFTNTLIFAVLASLAYMIYSIKEHTFTDCIDDWSELWFDEAFWHFLFSLILLVIMILWRPSANNQRYAFTPLVDLGEEDDEDNITLSEAFEGMKLRNTKNPSAVPDVKVNGDSKRNKAEDDLKWVEENIPTSGDIALPSLMDSDEELMTTKFEISKME